MEAFLVSTGVVALGEMGDKTQLLAMLLAVKFRRPLPIVLSGGTAKPRGFRELFEKTLRTRPLPIEVSEIRMARDPLTATARGALIAAMYEK